MGIKKESHCVFPFSIGEIWFDIKAMSNYKENRAFLAFYFSHVLTSGDKKEKKHKKVSITQTFLKDKRET